MVAWRIPGIFKNADAEKVNNEIKNIGDTLKPEDVLEYAKNNPNSELHKCFEWNDSIAAEKYRKQQAKEIITLIVTIPDKPEEPIRREYYCVETKDRYEAYRPTKLIFTNNDERNDLFRRAINELKAFQKKYKTLTELKDVFLAIDKL